MTIAAVTSELYSLPPQDFTAARNALVAQAKRDGDEALAGAIKELRRPSASAAVLNTLVRAQASKVEELLDVGGRLRAAQAAGAGDDLRALMRSRQQAMATLLAAAEQVAPDLGVRFTSAVQREVQATLIAALADSASEQALRSGTLVSGLAYAGFGDAIESAPPSSSSGDGEPGSLPRRQREAKERRATVERIVAERAEAVQDAESALAGLDEQLAENAREAERLRRLRDDADQRLTDARRAHLTAKREAEQAD
jgi:hypothetical protein